MYCTFSQRQAHPRLQAVRSRFVHQILMSKSELRLDAYDIEWPPTSNAHTTAYSETLVIYGREARENSHYEMKTVITEITEV